MDSPPKSILLEKESEYTVSAEGNSYVDAFAKIFQKLRQDIYSEIDGAVVQMETKDVFLIDLKVSEKKERFLLLFMPRTKQFYHVTAKLTVLVKYINNIREATK